MRAKNLSIVLGWRQPPGKVDNSLKSSYYNIAMDKIENAHDGFFKRVFANEENIRSFLDTTEESH